MRILGVDPGTHTTGWGVVEAAGSRVTRLASGVIRGQKGELATRLRHIADGLDHVLHTQRPDVMAIEMIFHAKNSRSALQLGHARGAALLCASRFGIPIHEYSPTEIKQSTTGRGRASKEQVQDMIAMILNYRDGLTLDETDALAVCLCHAHIASSHAAGLVHRARRNRDGVTDELSQK